MTSTAPRDLWYRRKNRRAWVRCSWLHARDMIRRDPSIGTQPEEWWVRMLKKGNVLEAAGHEFRL